MNRSGEGLSGGETTSKRVPHGEPYAGKLHVRFDERAGIPHGASRSTLHPSRSSWLRAYPKHAKCINDSVSMSSVPSFTLIQTFRHSNIASRVT